MAVFSVDHTRTFCFVEDAAEMIYRLSTNEATEGRAVNVGTQAPEIAMRDLAGIILTAVGRKAAIEAQPATVGSPPRRVPDMTLCSELTGYRSRVGLDEGVQHAYAWYRKEFNLA